jgi:MFS family permease
VLVTSFGVGFIVGSFSGSTGGSPARLRRRFILGLVLNGLGVLTCAAAPTMPVALLAFGLAGLGNGMYLVHERVFLQETVPERFIARAYGVKDAFASWGFGLAFFAAGALLSISDARTVFWVAGAGAIVAAGVTGVILQRARWKTEAQPMSYVEAPIR